MKRGSKLSRSGIVAAVVLALGFGAYPAVAAAEEGNGDLTVGGCGQPSREGIA